MGYRPAAIHGKQSGGNGPLLRSKNKMPAAWPVRGRGRRRAQGDACSSNVSAAGASCISRGLTCFLQTQHLGMVRARLALRLQKMMKMVMASTRPGWRCCTRCVFSSSCSSRLHGNATTHELLLPLLLPLLLLLSHFQADAPPPPLRPSQQLAAHTCAAWSARACSADASACVSRTSKALAQHVRDVTRGRPLGNGGGLRLGCHAG